MATLKATNISGTTSITGGTYIRNSSNYLHVDGDIYGKRAIHSSGFIYANGQRIYLSEESDGYIDYDGDFNFFSDGGTANIHAKGFYQYSDERLKNFHGSIKADLQKLQTLKKSYFEYKNEPGVEHIGVSAQEVQALYPEIVSTNKEGMLSVDYSKLSVVALKAIDELKQEIDNLKQEVNELKREK